MSAFKNGKTGIAAAAAIAAAVYAVPAFAGTTDPDGAGPAPAYTTISMSGATLMRPFTSSEAITFLQPGTSIDIGGVTYGGPAFWANTNNLLLQLAPKSGTVTSLIQVSPGVWQAPALRFEWHETGSIEGVFELSTTRSPRWPPRPRSTATP